MGGGEKLSPRQGSELHPALCRAVRRKDRHPWPAAVVSTQTGDAWLLDPSDQLATPIARDGDALPVHIEETDTNFAIGWTGVYRIDGAAFSYWDKNSGSVRTILGYPTQRITHEILKMFD